MLKQGLDRTLVIDRRHPRNRGEGGAAHAGDLRRRPLVRHPRCAGARRAGRFCQSRRPAARLRPTRRSGWTTGTRARRSSSRRRAPAPGACTGSSRTRICSAS
ncbi:MAG: hypothetical protein MZW92_53195 [Comamonadaceae bacterium]|nr:hypothetical protein [Comamonadaceae bacterium]